MTIVNRLKMNQGVALRVSRMADYELTTRERDVLRLLVTGVSSRQIAGGLDMKFYTVTTHLKSIYKKLGVHKRAGVVAKVLTEGLLADRIVAVPGLRGYPDASL